MFNTLYYAEVRRDDRQVHCFLPHLFQNSSTEYFFLYTIFNNDEEIYTNYIWSEEEENNKRVSKNKNKIEYDRVKRLKCF